MTTSPLVVTPVFQSDFAGPYKPTQALKPEIENIVTPSNGTQALDENVVTPSNNQDVIDELPVIDFSDFTLERPQGAIARKPEKPVGRMFSELEKTTLEWLIPGRIAKGVVSMFVGPSSVGKSTLAAYLASVVSNGGTFFDGTQCEESGVVLAMVEDESEVTTLQRLEDANANLENIKDLSIVEDEEIGLHGTSKEVRLSLPTHFKQLEMAIKQVNASLVVLDPLSAIMQNYEKNEWSRKYVIGPLSMIARRNNCAIVIINHFKKGPYNEKNIATAIMGGKCWYDELRLVSMITPDVDNTKIVNWQMLKCNVGKLNTDIVRYTGVTDEIGRYYIVFLKDNDTTTAIAPIKANKNRGIGHTILWYMAKYGRPLTGLILLQNLTIDGQPVPRGSIVSALSRLSEDGYIHQVPGKYGYYALHPSLQPVLIQQIEQSEQKLLQGPQNC